MKFMKENSKEIMDDSNEGTMDRLKLLYPNVSEPLPLSWSSTEKNSSIGLSNSNLRVHYKGKFQLFTFSTVSSYHHLIFPVIYAQLFFFIGIGKSHNDAASVRTTCPIPASCGLYYFEVKIISKGRDGYMGIGLTASSANNFKMNRLPGESECAADVDAFDALILTAFPLHI